MQEAPKITKDLLKIDWSKTASEIHNLIRGLSPVVDNETLLKDIAICPSAWFLLQDENGNNKRIKLQLTKLSPATQKTSLSIDTDNTDSYIVKDFPQYHTEISLLDFKPLKFIFIFYIQYKI